MFAVDHGRRKVEIIVEVLLGRRNDALTGFGHGLGSSVGILANVARLYARTPTRVGANNSHIPCESDKSGHSF